MTDTAESASDVCAAKTCAVSSAGIVEALSGAGSDLSVQAEALSATIIAIETARPAGSSVMRIRSARFFLRLFTVLNYVARREENTLKGLTKKRLLAENEFEVHAEMLEFLFLRVLHDRFGLGVLLHRNPLLVPVDRLGLLDQGGDHARKRARLL